MRLFEDQRNPAKPWVVQWRIDGKRKAKAFASPQAQVDFAKDLTRTAARDGLDAYRLNPDEARGWRAFQAELNGADLAAVLACWKKYGTASKTITVAKAVEQYEDAKKAEGVGALALSHYKAIFRRLVAAMGDRPAGTVQREDISAWIAKLDMAPSSRGVNLARVRGLFAWLKRSRIIAESPCEGIKQPRVMAEDIAILTVEQGKALFEVNAKGGKRRELMGRLALEAFAGLRFSSAQRITPADLKITDRGIVLPAASIKTQRREYVDGFTDNLWAWIKWSQPDSWVMTPRQYLTAKSAAMVRADITVHNGLRHSFATYDVAAHKDVGATATRLCHASPKMLFRHYKGRATEADGASWFEIVPPNPASS